MSLWYLFCIFLGVFAFGYFGAKGIVMAVVQSPSQKLSFDVDLSLGVVALLPLILCALLFIPLVTLTDSFYFYALPLLSIAVLLITSGRLKLSYKLAALLLICFACTYVLPVEQAIATGIWSTPFHLVMALAWLILIGLYAAMDRVPFLSMILSCGLALMFFLMSSFFQLIPPIFGYFAIAILVVQMGMNMFLRSVLVPQSGIYGALMIGFMWGGLSVLVMAYGYLAPVVIIYGYPLLEVVLSGSIYLLAFKKLSLQHPFLVEQALARKIMPTRVMRSIMMWSILCAALGTLAAISKIQIFAFYLALVIILINCYIRLTSWGEPRPRFRDLGRDLKAGFKELKGELAALPMKKKTVQKTTLKTPLKKTVPQKTVKKAKGSKKKK